MKKKLSNPEKGLLITLALALGGGIWGIWATKFPIETIIYHLKFFYSLFLFIAISIGAYYLILKEDKTVKKITRGSKNG